MIQVEELVAKRNEVYLATISMGGGEVDAKLDIIPVAVEYNDILKLLKRIPPMRGDTFII